ncbi:MAG TPA: LLM class flavin-dependent oxidoreductase [Alphaproteobacteria bacterium]|nr:LLM class flavin-dependent oxidoreductase [Alphaproteobacteria bacterium]
MKFSLIYEGATADITRAGERALYDNIVEQSVLADELGFDVVWSVEHHSLTWYSHISSPESLLAFIAARTKRIHVGHGVICLPFKMNHPIKVAERVATLDLLAKGRLEFGVGKGNTLQESGAFDIDYDQITSQVDEAMYLIPKMWMQETIEHHGLIDIPPRPIHPKPYQDPHPKMYMACSKPDSVKIAGSRGLGALVLGFSGPDEFAKKNALYREAYRNRDPKDQVGYRPNEHLAVLCPAIVLEDGEKARRIGVRGQRFFAESLAYWYAGGPPPNIPDLDVEAQEEEMERHKERVLAFLDTAKIAPTEQHTGYYNFDAAYGTPADAIAYVERLKAAGADEILFHPQMGTVPHEIIMETIANIGRHVIPHFRARGD